MTDKIIMNKKSISRVIISLLVVVGIMVMIFLFSTQNVTTSDGLSMKVARILAKVITKICELFPASGTAPLETKPGNFLADLNHYIRKGAHLSEYALLGGALTWHLKEGLTFRGKTLNISNVLLVLPIGALYAASDEFHQLFVEGRGAQIKDVIIDTIGVMLGIGIVILMIHIRAKKKRIE